MSSAGGMVEEGISLYGFIRSLPVEITIHNIGNIDSIALAVYLAASKRLVNPDATFLCTIFIFRSLCLFQIGIKLLTSVLV